MPCRTVQRGGIPYSNTVLKVRNGHFRRQGGFRYIFLFLHLFNPFIPISCFFSPLSSFSFPFLPFSHTFSHFLSSPLHFPPKLHLLISPPQGGGQYIFQYINPWYDIYTLIFFIPLLKAASSQMGCRLVKSLLTGWAGRNAARSG